MIDFRLNKKFKPLFDKPKTRYVLVTGGRAGMKTFMSTFFCSRLLAEVPGQNVLFTRYTMASANDTIVEEFKARIEDQELGYMFTQTKNDVYCTRTGSKISFRGLKSSSKAQTAKLKGLGCNVFFVDEAEEWLSEEEFDKLDLSIRHKDKNNLIVIVMNPTNKEHWVYKRWIENTRKTVWIDGFPVSVSTHPDVQHIHTTYLDNLKNLPDSYIKILKDLKEKNRKKYGHVVIGQWLEKREGVIYENWKEGKFDDSLPYLYGLDFGYQPDPLALIKVALDFKRKRIYLKEEVYEEKLDNEILAKRFEQVMDISKKKLIICDTNEPRTATFLRSKGWRMVEAEKPKGSIVQGIKEILGWEIIVDPDSSNLKNEFDNYVWLDKKSDTPDGMYNHLMDAMRYAFMYWVHYPGKKQKTRSANV